jgi:hypothetical protein
MTIFIVNPKTKFVEQILEEGIKDGQSIVLSPSDLEFIKDLVKEHNEKERRTWLFPERDIPKRLEQIREILAKLEGLK